MKSNFPRPGAQWSAPEEADFRWLLEQALQRFYARGEAIVLHPEAHVVLTAANGGRWKVVVDDAGSLSTEPYE